MTTYILILYMVVSNGGSSLSTEKFNTSAACNTAGLEAAKFGEEQFGMQHIHFKCVEIKD